jgi:calcineurin-like phosphoesterase family protein
MIHFTSDHHFWHNNVIRYCSRPFTSVEEMNELMVIAWNMNVHPDDTVYVLGDFSLAFRAVETFPQRLMGKKILVPGNHDFCHSYHKKSRNAENREKWKQKYVDHGFEVVSEQYAEHFEGLGSVLLCHHPYADKTTKEDEGGYEDKYEKWRPADNGALLLCGHIHEKWKTKRSSKGTLMINVGVDQHGFAPVSLDKIIKIAKENGS